MGHCFPRVAVESSPLGVVGRAFSQKVVDCLRGGATSCSHIGESASLSFTSMYELSREEPVLLCSQRERNVDAVPRLLHWRGSDADDNF